MGSVDLTEFRGYRMVQSNEATLTVRIQLTLHKRPKEATETGET